MIDRLGQTLYLTDRRGCCVAFTIIEAQPGRIGLVGPSGIPLSVPVASVQAMLATGGAAWSNQPEFRNDHHA